MSREKFPLTSRKSFGKFSEQEFLQENSGCAKKGGGSPSQNTSAKQGFGVFAGRLFLLSFSTETEWKEEYFGGWGEWGRTTGRQ